MSFENFLRRISPQSLRTFTFVHTSQSLFKDDISDTLPRVIRSSVDGHLTLAYACKSDSPNYGKVEVLHFKKSIRTYEAALIDFSTTQPRAQVTRNPNKCLECHRGSNSNPFEYRVIFKNYSSWDGLYGGHDDYLDNNSISLESQKFHDFKEQQANNPCYSTLPWLHQNEQGLSENQNYPYASVARNDTLGRRPNTRLTKAWLLLSYQQFARRLKNQAIRILGARVAQDFLITVLAQMSHGCQDQYIGENFNHHDEGCSLPSQHCLSLDEITETGLRILHGRRNGENLQRYFPGMWHRPENFTRDLSMSLNRTEMPSSGGIDEDYYLQRSILEELMLNDRNLSRRASEGYLFGYNGYSYGSAQYSCLDQRVPFRLWSRINSVSQDYIQVHPNNRSFCEYIYSRVKNIQRRYHVRSPSVHFLNISQRLHQ